MKGLHILPFAGYPDFNACVLDQKKKGHSLPAAKRICGKLQSEAETNRIHALNISLGGMPPAEFRIFAAGQVETSKGTFLFDDQAAQAVLASAAEQGNELMLDYDHASVSMTPADPALAGRAAGWFDLELRNGELWAVNVRWTPAAATALSNKEWRYMSPAFTTDAEGRITSLINVALTNLPATKNLQPLIAANLSGEAMTPEQMGMIAEALGLGADASVEDVIATIGAVMKKIQDGANGQEPGADAPAPDAAPPPDAQAAAETPPPDAAMQAASFKLCSLTGRESVGEALVDVELWRAAYLDLGSERAKIAKAQATLEANERRELVNKLISLGVETPGTAFVDATVKSPKLGTRLSQEPIAELRARAHVLSQTRGQTTQPRPPTSGSPELSAREAAMCTAKKIDPAKYLATRAAIAERNSGRENS